MDESPDSAFYAQPRFVAHIDPQTIDALTQFYAEFIPEQADVLDLMSSWISHLPQQASYGRVAGLGMNEDELTRNPRLSESVVHDLNVEPELPFEHGGFDLSLIHI